MLLNPILKVRKFSLRVTEFLKNIEQVYDKVGFETRPVGGNPSPALCADHLPLSTAQISLQQRLPQSCGHVLINIINNQEEQGRSSPLDACRLMVPDK